EPRGLDEYHYAQLFRVRRPGSAAAGEPRVREADPSDERRRIHFDAAARVREADPSDERRRIHFDAAARVREADPSDERRRIHFDAAARVREADPSDERRRIHFDAAARVREADPSDERRRIHFDAAEDEHWLALKDAVEPNRRNLNGLYRVDVSIADGVARCQRPRIAAWGVDTRL